MRKETQGGFTAWMRWALPEQVGSREMKDINEIRRDNLRGLVDDYGGSTGALASALGKDQSLISQFVSEKTQRPISNEMARFIEETLGLPYAYMDNQHHDSAVPEILRDIIICTEKALQQEGIRTMAAAKKADLILAFAEFFSPAHPPTVAAMRRIIRAKL